MFLKAKPNIPCLPPLKLLWTEDAFSFSILWVICIVWYDDSPGWDSTIGYVHPAFIVYPVIEDVIFVVVLFRVSGWCGCTFVCCGSDGVKLKYIDIELV